VEEKLFLRKATGLVREIGFATAVILALCNVIGLGWQKRVFQTIAWAPVRETNYVLGMPPVVMGFVLGGIVIVISAYCFGLLTACMPRAGGGYVLISRTLHPWIGYVCGWLYFWSTAVSYGLIAVAVMEAIALFGSLAGIRVADAVLNPVPMFFVGIAVIIVFSGLAFFGVRLYGYLLQALFWIPMIMTLLVYYLFLTATPHAMEAGVQTLYGHLPLDYTSAALAQGLAAKAVPYWAAVGTSIIGVYWSYTGYAAATFVAGEVKEANRTLPRALTLTGVLVAVVFITISWLMAHAASSVGQKDGFSLLSSIAYLNYGGGDFAKANLPKIGGWMPVIAYIQGRGAGFGAWVGLGLFLFSTLWVMNDIPPFLLTSSRITFAMAFDRLLPEWFGAVSERYHSPNNSILFVSLIALLGCASESGVFSKGAPWYVGNGVAQLFNTGVAATDIWDITFFTFLAVSVVVFPYLKREVWERGPFRGNPASYATLGILAVLGNLWMAWSILSSPHGYDITHPSWSDAGWYTPIAFTLFLIVLHSAMYWYHVTKGKRTGVSMTTIFASIPPE
jgi:APA family basic amino acid/polyamine antiporter